MRPSLLAGVATFALALTPSLAWAQDAAPDGAIPDKATGYGDSSGLDTLVPAEDDKAAPAAAAPTGDPVLDRLNALEAKIATLEARNKELEDKAAFNEDRIGKVEIRAAKSVQAGSAPTFSDIGGNFTFKPRGVIELDYAGYRSRAGGYDYNNGTDIRRARFGFDGTFLKSFKYRIEAEYVKGATNLLDAYISYQLNPKWLITVGQQKAPYGLEANTSDNFNTFLERGMANTAFGAVGAERRVGLTLAYVTDKLNATVGLFGAGEAVVRNPANPDEAYGVNGRITWDPILDTNKVLHFGVSGYRVTNFATTASTAVNGTTGAVTGTAATANGLSIGSAPDTRVDNGQLVSLSIAGNVAGAPRTGAKNATFVGAEAAGVYGPFSVQGEYDHLSVDRFGTASTVNVHGFYVFGSWFITGESRAFKNGVVDRLRPINDFDPSKGSWGAFELAVRYDELNLTDKGLSPLSKKGESWTGAVNWYLNPYLKLMFNYIHFKGQNSPLFVNTLPVASATANRTAKGDAFATRLHVDF